MTISTGPNQNREPDENAGPEHEDVGSLSVPERIDNSPELTALAKELPDLLPQLRGLFFGVGDEELRALGKLRSDGEILGLAITIYSDPKVRSEVIAYNRKHSLPPLTLGEEANVMMVEMQEKGEHRPGTTPSWDGMPLPFRRIDEAIRVLPADALLQNSLFVPTEEHVAQATNEPNSNLAWALARSPNQTPTPELIAAAMDNPDSSLAEGLARHPNLVPTSALVAAALSNPNSSTVGDRRVASTQTPDRAAVMASRP